MEDFQHPCVIQWLDSVKKATKDVYIQRITEVLEIEAKMHAEHRFKDFGCVISEFLKNLNEKGVYGSQMFSILSPVRTFMKMSNKVDIYELYPNIVMTIKNWEKDDNIKKSNVS